MSIHREIDAHLRAADRSPGKADQHLIAATRYAEAGGVAHFGRWSEQQVHRREARRVLLAEEQRIKNREQPTSPVIEGEAARAPAQLAYASHAHNKGRGT